MRQLGELLGIAQTNISNWENAGVEPNYETLIKISNIFKCKCRLFNWQYSSIRKSRR
jgi:transcriptional regulator with XRE-family HTH domain